MAEAAHTRAAAGSCSEAQANLEADIDPEVLIVMASVDADFAGIDDSLGRGRAGIKQRGLARAECERAAVYEPVIHADMQAELGATAAVAEAEPDHDADLEI